LPSVRARHLQRAGTGLSGAAPWRPGGTRRVRCPARGRGAPTLSELDGAAKFSPALHTRGDIAAPLIYAASYLDFLSIDRDRFEVVAVTGNSMGWYTALACAGGFGRAWLCHRRCHGRQFAEARARRAGGAGAGREDWRVDPALRRAVDAAMARHGVLPSIHLGGMLVVAGARPRWMRWKGPARPVASAPAPCWPRPVPHAADGGKRQRGAVALGHLVRPVRGAAIDGRAVMMAASDAESLDYTFGYQILAPYDFTTAMTVAIREFAPDRIVLLGPAKRWRRDRAGAVALNWLDIGSKDAFSSRQGE
jgi:hypothetical protein